MQSKMASHMANMVKMKQLEIELNNFKAKAQQECKDATAQAMVFKQQVQSLQSVRKYDVNFTPPVSKLLLRKNPKAGPKQGNQEYQGGMIKKGKQSKSKNVEKDDTLSKYSN